MPSVSLELFKKHVRADDFADDDEYLAHLLEAAETHVVQATARTPQELAGMGGGEMPRPLAQAVMMLAAQRYNQRESVASTQMHQVPDSLTALVKPFRKLVEERPA